MKSQKDVRGRAAQRVGPQVRVYSTSEGRANFAEALETAHAQNAVIGFGRYGQTIAALVPVEAIYMLAGRGNVIAPAVREEITAFSQRFLATVRPDARASAPREATKTRESRTAAAKKKPKSKGAKKRK